MNTRHDTKLMAALLALGACGSVIAADGVKDEAEPDGGGLTEIVVTATKTGETQLQNTPIAISAFSADQLAQSSLSNVKDLAGYVPNLSISQSTTYALIFIRGIGSTNVNGGSDPSTTVQVDGVYMGRPFAQFADFLDVQRVEVLRGPQGTLYGRNAVGGTINVVSRQPTDSFEAQERVSVGNYKSFDNQFYVSGPLVPGTVTGSISASYSRHDPYIENIISTGNDIFDGNSGGVRGQLRITPTEGIAATTRADIHLSHERTESFSKLNAPFDPVTDSILGDYSKVALNMPNHDRVQSWGVAEDLSFDLTSQLTVKSLSAYRKNINRVNIDSDDSEQSITHVFQGEDQDQTSQELSLVGNFGRLTFVTGLYYLHEKVNTIVTVQVFGPGVARSFQPATDTDAYAAYTQGTYKFTDTIGLTLGVRYTGETKSIDQFVGTYRAASGALLGAPITFSRKDRFHGTTPKVGLQWTPLEDLMVYASATRGYKSGGFNFSATSATTAGFQPEDVWSYEIGTKTEWLEHRLRANLTAFKYNYTNLQEFLATAPGVAVIANAAQARIKGVELELAAKPLKGLELSANLAWLDAKYTSYPNAPLPQSLGPFSVDATGNSLDNSPPYSASVAAQYTWMVAGGSSTYARSEYLWQDRQFNEPTNYVLQSIPAHGLLNAVLGYAPPDASWKAELWGRNLTNKQYFTGTQDAGATFSGQPGAPRTYGVRFTKTW
jgi:iron complex outermembrane recepter protein